MPDLSDFANSIAGIESGGRYDLLGPQTKGDRAYGKYQVMGANIPSWTQAALGQSLTPEQFLASPEAQDAVFQHRFGQYVEKYGPEGAAKAWFAGEKGMNNPNAKDVLGTSVASYGSRFMKGLGQPQAEPAAPPPQAAPLDLMSFQRPAAPANMSAFNWSPNPTAQPQQPEYEAPMQLDQAPQMAVPQILYPQRRPPQLASLQQLLQARLRPGFSLKG